MTDWYKMDPIDWNDGTEELSLEQEAAYLRICHAIYITERPIHDNGFVVAGLLRCNDRKAKRLISELVAAGKITVENGLISNRRAVEEVSNRNRTRAERKSAGSRGGVESAKARAKPLENNDPVQAIASTQNEPEEKREEESREPLTPLPKRFANPSVVLQGVLDPMSAQAFATHCEEKGRRLSSQTAEEIVSVLRRVRELGGNPADAIRFAIRKGWVSLDLEYLQNGGFPFKASSADDPLAKLASWPTDRWQRVLEHSRQHREWQRQTYGPPPFTPGCLVPAGLLTDEDRELAA